MEGGLRGLPTPLSAKGSCIQSMRRQLQAFERAVATLTATRDSYQEQLQVVGRALGRWLGSEQGTGLAMWIVAGSGAMGGDENMDADAVSTAKLQKWLQLSHPDMPSTCSSPSNDQATLRAQCMELARAVVRLRGETVVVREGNEGNDGDSLEEATSEATQSMPWLAEEALTSFVEEFVPSDDQDLSRIVCAQALCRQREMFHAGIRQLCRQHESDMDQLEAQCTQRIVDERRDRAGLRTALASVKGQVAHLKRQSLQLRYVRHMHIVIHISTHSRVFDSFNRSIYRHSFPFHVSIRIVSLLQGLHG